MNMINYHLSLYAIIYTKISMRSQMTLVTVEKKNTFFWPLLFIIGPCSHFLFIYNTNNRAEMISAITYLTLYSHFWYRYLSCIIQAKRTFYCFYHKIEFHIMMCIIFKKNEKDEIITVEFKMHLK